MAKCQNRTAPLFGGIRSLAWELGHTRLWESIRHGVSTAGGYRLGNGHGSRSLDGRESIEIGAGINSSMGLSLLATSE